MEKHINYIINIINSSINNEDTALEQLNNYLQKENFDIKAINNQHFDILVHAIEENAPLKLIKLILDRWSYENLDYSVVSIEYEPYREVMKVPLFLAFKQNNLDLVKLLLEYKADINYTIEESKSNSKVHLLKYLVCEKLLNKSILKYILQHGLSHTKLDSDTICKILKQSDDFALECLKTIFSHYIFDNKFIINLLIIYEEKKPFSKDDFQNIITEEKKKIIIHEDMYNSSTTLYHINPNMIKMLYYYDCSDSEVLFRRINKYNILTHAVRCNDYSFVQTIISHLPFNFKAIFSEEVIKIASDHDNMDILKLLISSSLNALPLKKVDTRKDAPIEKYDIRYLSLILNVAIRIRNMKLIKYLIEDKDYKDIINISICGINGEYPLIVALYSGDGDILNYLLDHNVDYFIKDINGNSILSILMSTCSHLLDHLLKKPNIDINEKNSNQISPVENAIQQNNIEILKKLLDYGIKNGIKVKINEKDANGNSIFLNAIIQNNLDIVNLLLGYGIKNKIDININEKNNNGNYPLLQAVQQNNTKLVDLLMEYGKVNNIDLITNDCDIFGNHPLLQAISIKNIDIVITLTKYGIKKKYDMHITDKDGNNLLILSYKRDKRIFNFLIKYIDFLNEKDSNGITLLHYAIDDNDCSIIKLLINNGADINIKNNLKYSPLHLAITKNDYYLIEALLLNKNILLNTKNSKGETPLISLIKKYSSYSYNEKYFETMKTLINRGTDVNLPDSESLTPLIHAIKTNQIEIVKLLIEKGANINYIDANKKTPLIHSIENCKLDIVKLLIEKGANINYSDNNKKTVLMNACQIKDSYYNRNIVLYLLDHGANVNSKDNTGNIPLMYAVFSQNLEIIEILVKFGGNIHNINNANETLIDINQKYYSSKYEKKKINQDIKKILQN